MISIIAIGKQHDHALRAGLERYQVRLKKPYDVQWSLIPHSLHTGAKAAEEESDKILKRLGPEDFLLLLDEGGSIIDSPGLSEQLQKTMTQGRRIVCVIGGAYGVSDELKARADFEWSLSKLVFPHQLVRLILLEQLYRAQTIARGEPYHHE